MYAGCSYTTLCTIYSVRHTHTRTHTICPPDVVNGQTAEILLGELQSPRDHSFKKLRRYFFSETIIKCVLRSAALCCLFWKLQLDRQNPPVLSLFYIHNPSVRMCAISKTFGPSTICSRNHPCAELRMRTHLSLTSQALQNHHNKTLAMGINTHTDINGQQTSFCGYCGLHQNKRWTILIC